MHAWKPHLSLKIGSSPVAICSLSPTRTKELLITSLIFSVFDGPAGKAFTWTCITLWEHKKLKQNLRLNPQIPWEQKRWGIQMGEYGPSRPFRHFWDCTLAGSSLFGESLVWAGCIAIDFWVHGLIGFCLPEGVWVRRAALIWFFFRATVSKTHSHLDHQIKHFWDHRLWQLFKRELVQKRRHSEWLPQSFYWEPLFWVHLG